MGESALAAAACTTTPTSAEDPREFSDQNMTAEPNLPGKTGPNSRCTLTDALD